MKLLLLAITNVSTTRAFSSLLREWPVLSDRHHLSSLDRSFIDNYVCVCVCMCVLELASVFVCLCVLCVLFCCIILNVFPQTEWTQYYLSATTYPVYVCVCVCCPNVTAPWGKGRVAKVGVATCSCCHMTPRYIVDHVVILVSFPSLSFFFHIKHFLVGRVKPKERLSGSRQVER